jgi:anti-sigma factor RsiW
MNCAIYQKWIPLAVLGELAGDRQDRLARHTETCEACRQELEQLTEIAGLLSTSSDHALSDGERLRLENDVLRRVVRERAGRTATGVRAILPVLVRVAAAIALVTAGYLARPALADWFNGTPPIAQTHLSPAVEQYNRSAGTGYRFSGQGLKAIVKGRKALDQELAGRTE